MTLAADIITDMAVFMDSDDFAESITWAGGDAFDAVVIRGDDLANIDMATFDDVSVDAVAYVAKADVATPVYRDIVVTVDGTYRFIGKTESDAACFVAVLKKDERPVI